MGQLCFDVLLVILPFCIPMDFPIQINTISMGLSIIIFQGVTGGASMFTHVNGNVSCLCNNCLQKGLQFK